MKVSQVLCAAGPVDAVTNQGLECRRLFQSWGWDGADFSAVLAPGVQRRSIRRLREFEPEDEDAVVVHYSGFASGLERVFDRAPRTLLISHNITPARYFWAHEPVEAVHCELAEAQLTELGSRADVLAGVSQFNVDELRELTGRDGEVIPVLFDRAGLAAPPADRRAGRAPTVLFVGRLVPHKRQDLVIRAFANYHRRRPDAKLVLVGISLSPAFEAYLRELAAKLAPGAVSFESGISRSRLAEHYANADVFLCLSEHEGFCIPLLESFHFGLPVVARDAGAIREVVADAGVLLENEDDAFTIAELLELVIGDEELRAELANRAQRRLAAYDYGRTAERLRQAVSNMVPA